MRMICHIKPDQTYHKPRMNTHETSTSTCPNNSPQNMVHTLNHAFTAVSLLTLVESDDH